MPNATSAAAALRAVLQALLLSSAVLLAACGGSSSDGGNADTDRAASPAPVESPDPETPDDTDTPTDDNTPPDETARTPYDRPAVYPEMASQALQFVATSTGKRLGVYVTLPANADGTPADGPFPVILVQSAYNLSISGASPSPSGVLTGSPDPFVVKRGYAMVAVDALGTGVSEGGWELLGYAEQRAYGDVVDWIEQQPWFNGKLGLAGSSYMAISSLFTAQQRPDSIDAIFADVPLGDAQRGTVGTGGVLNALFMSTWMTLTHLLTTQNIPAALQNPSLYSIIAGSTREHIAQVDGYYLPLINDALYGEPYVTYDSDFWRERSPIENIDKIKAPTIIMGALQDIFQRDAPLLYEKLKQNTEARLFIYGGDHVSHMINAFAGGDRVDPAMNILLQWFDHYLMGLDTGVENIPPVTQLVKNYSPLLGFGYFTASDWPHPQAEPERWYLRGDMGLSRSAAQDTETTHSLPAAPFAELDIGKNTNGSLLQFAVHINDGTDCSVSYRQWTLGAGGLLSSRPLDSCFYDSNDVEANALNYESAPLDEDYYINGPIQADIWMETSAHEALVSVRIDEVSGRTGTVHPISNGLLLASARAVDEQRSRYLHGEMIQPYHYLTQEAVMPVEPGEVFKMPVEIFPSSFIVRKGNRLRVSIATSNQAQGVLNYPRRELAKDGITTIHNSAEYPSSVVVPIVPMSALD